MTLMAIADTPHSIALGSAIGIFFGFTPLYPLKTLLSIAVAWICRCNKVAAAVAVNLHDVMIWAMPAIYVAEYQFGCWILNRPVAQRVHLREFRLHDYVHWHDSDDSPAAAALAGCVNALERPRRSKMTGSLSTTALAAALGPEQCVTMPHLR